jgi:hypothetical protein
VHVPLVVEDVTDLELFLLLRHVARRGSTHENDGRLVLRL